jgi:hypothetical protein
MTIQANDINRILAIIEVHKERKYLLQEKLAKLGFSADPSVEIEIQDIEKQIAKLEDQIKKLQESNSNDVFSLTLKTKVYNKRTALFPKIISDLNLMVIAIENAKWLLESRQNSSDVLQEEDFNNIREIFSQVTTANERFIRKYRANSVFVPSNIDEVITQFVVSFSELTVRISISNQPMRSVVRETHDNCKQIFNEVIILMRLYIENGK